MSSVAAFSAGQPRGAQVVEPGGVELGRVVAVEREVEEVGRGAGVVVFGNGACRQGGEGEVGGKTAEGSLGIHLYIIYIERAVALVVAVVHGQIGLCSGRSQYAFYLFPLSLRVGDVDVGVASACVDAAFVAVGLHHGAHQIVRAAGEPHRGALRPRSPGPSRCDPLLPHPSLRGLVAGGDCGGVVALRHPAGTLLAGTRYRALYRLRIGRSDCLFPHVRLGTSGHLAQLFGLLASSPVVVDGPLHLV